MKRALVTGANGFTGSHLVKALVGRGVEVVAYVRASSNLERLAGVEVEWVYGDIGDRLALDRALQGVDTVFHTAAYVELGIVDGAKMERVNVEGTRTLLAAAQAAGVSKMVYCSTIGIYGDTRGQIINETFQRQQEGFSSAYDRTKYLAQQLVDEAARQGFPVVSVMPSGIFGPDDPHFGPVIHLFLKKRLKFWLGGDRITGIVHVDDLVTAMILAAEKAPTGEHYIISAGELPSREMFRLLSKATGIPTPQEAPKPLVVVVASILEVLGQLFNWNPPIGRERLHYVYERCVRVDSSKARKALNWQPRPVEDVLLEFLPSSRRESSAQ